MGEQSPAQPQSQSQAHNDSATSQKQNQTQSDSLNASITVATATELTNVTPPPKTSAPPKIPLRPRKIRKISPEEVDPNSSPQITTTTTAAIVPIGPPKSTSKATKTKLTQQRELVPRIVARFLSCEGEDETTILHLRIADPLLASFIDFQSILLHS